MEMSGKVKTEQVNVRLDAKTKKQLEKEGQAMGLDLSTYIRHLVFTHPNRKK